MKEQLSLLDKPERGDASVWSSMDAEQRALVVATLARLMAKAVADLRATVAARREGSDE